MVEYYTSGQVAKKLRVSVSTLKRWISNGDVVFNETRNASGWMLFSSDDMEKLKTFKKERRRNGKHFNRETLLPVRSKKPSMEG